MLTKDKAKRFATFLFLSICAFALALFLGSCEDEQIESPDFPYVQGFSVNYIDVGNGDCIFIRFPDGKNLMIDCGARSDKNYKEITRFLDGYSIKSIDWLVLTHPDVDHVGNAEKIIKSYDVKNAFIPDVYAVEEYPTFSKTVNALNEKGVQTKISQMYTQIATQDYFLAFLSPSSRGAGGYYGEFNALNQPSDSAVNDLSPIIYLEYKSVRFLFTGDAGYKQEEILLENVNAGLIKAIHGDRVDLYDVDFLKVAHHGADDCTSEEFLQVVKPKYAVISVGAQNNYGHPSYVTLNRILECSQDVTLLRTDVSGSITVGVDLDGDVSIIKQSD